MNDTHIGGAQVLCHYPVVSWKNPYDGVSYEIGRNEYIVTNIRLMKSAVSTKSGALCSRKQGRFKQMQFPILDWKNWTNPNKPDSVHIFDAHYGCGGANGKDGKGKPVSTKQTFFMFTIYC